MSSLNDTQDVPQPRLENSITLKKVPSYTDDTKIPKKSKEKEKEGGSRHPSPKMIRRGRPTDIPPIQQELADRVKSEPFVKKFSLPSTETLIKDYSAALYKQIPLHGRMYVSQNYICFESKIFNIKTMEVIPFKDISHIRKKSNKMFSVGIHIDVGSQTYHFASFVARDKTFVLLHDLWRQVVPAHSDSSDPDEDDDDDDEDEVDAGANKAPKLIRSFTEAIPISKQARSLPPSPRNSLRLTRDVLTDASLAPLDLGVVTPLQTLKAIDASILESIGSVPPVGGAAAVEASSSSGSTPPAGTSAAAPEVSTTAEAIVEAVDPIPIVPVTEYYDDEHLSPGEADDTEDGFLESEAFFADRSEFIRKYHEKRGDKEISIPKWANSPQFGMIRNIQYYAPVKVPLGPDKTRVQETQRYVLQKTRLLIETISVMFDIPYGDCFRLETKISVSSPSATAKTCSLSISMCVHFVKKTWFKGKIESQSLKEMKESFRQWIEMAREELASPAVIERMSGPAPQILTRSAPVTPQVVTKDPPAASITASSTSNAAPSSQPSPATTSSSSATVSAPKESAPQEQRLENVATEEVHVRPRIKKIPPTPVHEDKGLSIYGLTVPLPSLSSAPDQHTILMGLLFGGQVFCGGELNPFANI